MFPELDKEFSLTLIYETITDGPCRRYNFEIYIVIFYS